MTQKKLKEILAAHSLYLRGCLDDARADLSGAKLSGADLSWADLSRAKLSGADLSGADLSWAKLSGADLSGTDLSRAKLSGAKLLGADLSGAKLSEAKLLVADLSWAKLSGADLSEAKLSRADLSRADLSSADLSRADLSGTDLSWAKLSGTKLSGAYLLGADLSGADLSGAKGLTSAADFLKTHFEQTEAGYIAYKTFNSQYRAPSAWSIEKGSIIEENVNFDRCEDCGCGINVAPIEWVERHYRGAVWKVLIRWEWLAGVCVPYRSDGKIRCERVELLEIVKEVP